MTGAAGEPMGSRLEQSLVGALRVDHEDIDIDAACRAYVEAGYEMTSWLRTFLENYAGVTVAWQSARGTGVNELTTSIEAALDAYPGNVRNYARRLGRDVLPIGMAFATEECLLLADNDDILLAGDAGMQRVARGFERAMRALISNEWDKTFF
jgi:hypothetical protein